MALLKKFLKVFMTSTWCFAAALFATEAFAPESGTWKVYRTNANIPNWPDAEHPYAERDIEIDGFRYREIYEHSPRAVLGKSGTMLVPMDRLDPAYEGARAERTRYAYLRRNRFPDIDPQDLFLDLDPERKPIYAPFATRKDRENCFTDMGNRTRGLFEGGGSGANIERLKKMPLVGSLVINPLATLADDAAIGIANSFPGYFKRDPALVVIRAGNALRSGGRAGKVAGGLAAYAGFMGSIFDQGAIMRGERPIVEETIDEWTPDFVKNGMDYAVRSGDYFLPGTHPVSGTLSYMDYFVDSVAYGFANAFDLDGKRYAENPDIIPYMGY